MKGKTMPEDSIHAAAVVAAAPATSVPPATVAAASFLGYTPAEWLVWASLLWIGIQISAFIYERVIRIRKACKERKQHEEA